MGRKTHTQTETDRDRDRDRMWRLKTAEEGTEVKPSIGEPLVTLCTPKLAGRQVWDFEETKGTATLSGEEAKTKEAVEKARQEYVSNRKKGVKHSADELLRIQRCGPDYKDVARVRPAESKASLGSSEEVDEVLLDESLSGGLEFYQQLQLEDGHWPGDYGGPMFLMPGLIITCYVTGSMDAVLPSPHRAEMLRYLKNHQNDDGGYGLHIEGHSTMFGTVLSYVSMRLLGAEAEDSCCSKARKWILIHGGATLIPSWGKFWLAVLGCFEWSGLNPVPPEVWLLPYSGYSGIGYMHPGRFWCHCRMVYLPMSYIYGARIVGDITPLVKALRDELYLKPYKSIDWNKARNEVSAWVCLCVSVSTSVREREKEREREREMVCCC